jgi:hypothetical protein
MRSKVRGFDGMFGDFVGDADAFVKKSGPTGVLTILVGYAVATVAILMCMCWCATR